MDFVHAIICLSALTALDADGASILFVTPLGKSHLNIFLPIMKNLRERHHQVHVVVSSEMVDSVPPGYDFKIVETKEIPVRLDYLQEYMMDSINLDTIKKVRELVMFSEMMCYSVLSSSTFQGLLRRGKRYDLVIVDSLVLECIAAATRPITNHTMFFSTTSLPFWRSTSVPMIPSFVPVSFDDSTSVMPLSSRLKNTVIVLVSRLIFYYEILPTQQRMLEKFVPHSPNVYDVLRETFFMMTNSDPVLTSPRPSMPNVIDVGGLHCREAKTLPKKFQDMVRNKTFNGFILFSLGSFARSDLLPQKTISAFMEAFSKLDVKVIWKYEGKFGGHLPSNVELVDWFPQQDLLGHHKIRLFITHGGQLSLQEAICHKVPIFGVPLFADQFGNIARIKELGIGEKIDLTQVTSKTIFETINKILNDNRYAKSAAKYSLILRDQPQNPLERATFFIEYLIRHDGAHHLRSPGDNLNFFQYFVIDVVLCIVCIILFVLTVIFFLTKYFAKVVDITFVAKKLKLH